MLIKNRKDLLALQGSAGAFPDVDGPGQAVMSREPEHLGWA